MASNKTKRRDAILGRMTRMDQAADSKTFVGQIYSVPGAGKTLLGAELAQRLKGEGQIIFADAREGWISLEDRPDLQEDVIYTGSYYPAEDLSALADLMLEDRQTQGPTSDVTVVMLDEFTTWYKDVLEDVTRARTGIGEEENLPEIVGKDHGPAAAIMETILSKFVRIPDLHVILVAHAREKNEATPTGGTRTTYSPNYPPLMRINIEAMLHSSVYLQRKIDGRGQARRTIFTAPSGTIQAKNRLATMPIGEISLEQYLDAVTKWHLGAETNGEVIDYGEEAPEGATDGE